MFSRRYKISFSYLFINGLKKLKKRMIQKYERNGMKISI